MKVLSSNQSSANLYKKSLVYMWIMGGTIAISLFNFSKLMEYSGVIIYILLFILILSLRLLMLGEQIEELENGINAKR
ncbi:hypothetical protein UT300012_23620 [Paraclostridium bifermentans]